MLQMLVGILALLMPNIVIRTDEIVGHAGLMNAKVLNLAAFRWKFSSSSLHMSKNMSIRLPCRHVFLGVHTQVVCPTLGI